MVGVVLRVRQLMYSLVAKLKSMSLLLHKSSGDQNRERKQKLRKCPSYTFLFLANMIHFKKHQPTMRTNRIGLLISIQLLTAVIGHRSFAQILTSDPPFPTQDDVITVYYNTTTGNGDLQGVFPVYAHTGVISNYSANETDWQHVQGNWATADPEVLMTSTGESNEFSIEINPQTFYELNGDEVVTRLMFVFRNQSGSVVGRNEDGSDIYLDLYQPGFNAGIQSPALASHIVDAGEEVEIHAVASATAELLLTVNGTEVENLLDATELDYTFSETTSGEYIIEFTAFDGIETVTESITIIVLPAVNIESAPAGTVDGINYISGSTVRLQLYAPNKDYVFVLGDMNDWQFDLDYMMNRTPDGLTYWIELNGISPGQEYRFQYHVGDEAIRVADIYSEKILDFWNDPWIPDETYPALTDYPAGLTSEPVSVFQTNQTAFDWTDESYQRPPKERLVIYELLVRDFTEARNYQTMLDTLDYLDSLNITAIELMPINEFEGNDSWGYNPSFYFAPDKAYGTEEAFKAFINECHERGIAVIMDIALNHSFGQNPMVRMYFDASDGQYGSPTAENPWFNTDATHDFSVGYDFNHENSRTRDFCKRAFGYWMEEYHIDGYRLDLSKGYTQNYTVGNLGAWADYDQSRINILTDYYNHMQSVEPGCYVILEHFADNDEELVLSNTGMLVWGNLNHEYTEASMGYASNLSWGSYQSRGWGEPHLVTYAESHDEERINYKNQEFGNLNGTYNIQNLATACARQELVHALLIPLPGPKMIYQFGELGYDFSINYCMETGTISNECRTYAKPVRWDYYDVEARLHLYKVVSAINHLKQTYSTFSTDSYTFDVGGTGKRLILNDASMDAVVSGNFNVIGINMIPGFQHTGTWYDYITGDAFEVNDLSASFFFNPGEYHIYTDVPLPVPNVNVGVNEILAAMQSEIAVFPNPASEQFTVASSSAIYSICVYDFSGRKIIEQRSLNSQKISFDCDALIPGIYSITVNAGQQLFTQQLIIE